MIAVEREGTISAPLEQVRLMLSEPANLPRLLTRIRRVEVGGVEAGGIALVAHIALGGPLGLQRYHGHFRADAETISFEASKPFPVLARWQLAGHDNGTLVTALLQMEVDTLLKPLGRIGGRKLIDAIEQEIAEEIEDSIRRAEWLSRTGGA